MQDLAVDLVVAFLPSIAFPLHDAQNLRAIGQPHIEAPRAEAAFPFARGGSGREAAPARGARDADEAAPDPSGVVPTRGLPPVGRT